MRVQVRHSYFSLFTLAPAPNRMLAAGYANPFGCGYHATLMALNHSFWVGNLFLFHNTVDIGGQTVFLRQKQGFCLPNSAAVTNPLFFIMYNCVGSKYSFGLL